MDERERVARDDALLDEESRQYTFKKVKELYKQGSIFERLARKTKGEAPDWKKIEEYDQEILDYLEAVRRGDTFAQKQQEREHDRRAYKSGGKIQPYTEEELNKKRFDKFVAKLMKSESELKKEIEENKRIAMDSYEKYGRNVYR
ncbi:MAG: hypothetical protein IJL74_03950 [Bacilli bacterium]|nr:hypothetical protein [Bacilli bacterium]